MSDEYFGACGTCEEHFQLLSIAALVELKQQQPAWLSLYVIPALLLSWHYQWRWLRCFIKKEPIEGMWGMLLPYRGRFVSILMRELCPGWPGFTTSPKLFTSAFDPAFLFASLFWIFLQCKCSSLVWILLNRWSLLRDLHYSLLD